MAYVLENITPTEQEKIISDAEGHPSDRNSLIHAKDHQEFPSTWAVDKERNCYLLTAPVGTREEVTNRPYFFFWDNKLYKFFREGWFGHNFRFKEEIASSDAFLITLQSEIALAFAVYGESGRGPLNELGVAEFAVIPVFKAGA